MSNNPWAGLASYQDPASGSTLLFCGRDNESYDLAALVDDNIFCTLYGKSGTGKTSLLNAGMFPRLRDMGYLPLSIRLGMEALGSTFQQCIAARLGKAATLQTADTVPLPADDQDEQWLWAWFARTRFVDTEGKVRFPVLVFDQFEEVFRSRRAEAETLLRQVHFMMDPSHSLGDDYDYNFRFLASIREDDLYLLEDSLDRHFMGDMKQCRYRLNALSDEGARDVILKPGEGLFAAGEQDAIVDTVIGIARSADGSINTNILSLVCSRIYDHYRRSGDSHISLDLVKRFVSSNPFEQFYNEVTESLGEKEKQFIEDRLVDAAGRRGSVSEPDFEKNVPNGAHLLEGTGRILQRVASGTEGRSYRIELIHDSFCAPLADQKLKRAARRRRRITIAVSILALIVATVAAYIIVMSIRNARQTREILIQQEKFYANQASQILDEGDTYTALLLLNELTDPDGPFAKIPLQPEAEYQMRRAVRINDTSEWKVTGSWHLSDNPIQVQMTKDCNRLIYATTNKVCIIDCKTGKEIKRFTHSFEGQKRASDVKFTLSHNEKYLAVQIDDFYNSVLVYNIEQDKNDCVRLVDPSVSIRKGNALYGYFDLRSSVFFTKDDKHVVSLMYKDSLVGRVGTEILAFDVFTGRKTYGFEYDSNYTIEGGNENGTCVASMNYYGDIVISEKSSGRLLRKINLGHIVGDDWFVWKYVADDKLIFINTDNGAVYCYEVSKAKWGKVINKKYDMRMLGDAQVSETEILMSNEDTVFLYDLNTYEMKSYCKIDTTKYDYVFMNKNKENNLLLVSWKRGVILSLEYQQQNAKQTHLKIDSRYPEYTELGTSMYPVIFIGDSLLCEVDNSDSGWAKISVYNINRNRVVASDSVKGILQLGDISPNGCYLLCDAFYYIKDADGARTLKKEAMIFNIRKGKFLSRNIDMGEWGRFFIDNENICFFSDLKYDTVYSAVEDDGSTQEEYQVCSTKLYRYNVPSGDTATYTANIEDIVFEKVDCFQEILLCDNGSKWMMLDVVKRKIKYLDEMNCLYAKFTPNGKYVLGLSANGVASLFRTSDMALIEKRKVDCSSILAMSPDSKCVLMYSDVFNRVELWNLTPMSLLDEWDNKYLSSILDGHYIYTPRIYYTHYTGTYTGSVDGVFTFDSEGSILSAMNEPVISNNIVWKIPFIKQSELISRARDITGGRKLTEEEKNLLME